jgi:hypothetical protein
MGKNRPSMPPPAVKAETHVPKDEGPNAIADAWLEQMLNDAIVFGLRPAATFFEAFPLEKLINKDLFNHPEIRGKILVAAKVIKDSVVSKIKPEDLPSDIVYMFLKTALDSKDTTLEQLLDAFPIADRIKILSRPRLWNFIATGAWWETETDANREWTTVSLDRAFTKNLITHASVLKSIGSIHTCMELLMGWNSDAVMKIAAKSLELGLKNVPFTPDDVFSIISFKDLIEAMGVKVFFEKLINPLAEQLFLDTEAERQAAVQAFKAANPKPVKPGPGFNALFAGTKPKLPMDRPDSGHVDVDWEEPKRNT